jgi:uncharacterized protein
MRRHFVFFLVLLPILLPRTATARQTAPPAQTASSRQIQPFRWTEADRKALLAKARQGDADSQFWLGTGYEQGWFGKANFHKALKWLRAAAAQDNVDAQACLGRMYEGGEGVRQNYVAAAVWYRMAAEHVPDRGGASQGRNDLGLLYLSGLGVPKDYVQAYMWFRLASNSGANLSEAKSRMTPEKIREAERLAAEWKNSHPDP